jgi:hypothetical protein
LSEKYQVQLAYKTVHKIFWYKLKAKLKTPRPYSIKKDVLAEENLKKKTEIRIEGIIWTIWKRWKNLHFCQDETRLGLKTISGKRITVKFISV